MANHIPDIVKAGSILLKTQSAPGAFRRLLGLYCELCNRKRKVLSRTLSFELSTFDPVASKRDPPGGGVSASIGRLASAQVPAPHIGHVRQAFRHVIPARVQTFSCQIQTT